jgi:multiple sugar transport system permease protein
VLILMVPAVLVYLALQRLFERGLLSGSLKG